ncbi:MULTISPECIES: c-type cytochrome [Roseobacteraceae]|uniref:Cytochrome c-554(548) n=1 Tax=Pseudosulfitobacter pseudonitzschiae TaxID=1402135 RepID=A0A221JVS0_9RHOB|nr:MULTISPECIES: c-type cytochrome [Roseobacteraceae]ASM70845.1 cytochrome c-554(548) [Pseudosulfitobacter pseudonitzschiae]
MTRVFQTLAALAVCGFLAAAAIVGLGLYNVSARQGHLPGVGWLLHTTFKQSVRLRAPAAEKVPDDITSPDRIQLGALHFQTACAFCHAVPGQSRSATARSMNPPPPHVSDAVSQWKTQHMFWIVEQGVKMSGMPHWPADGRGDEIWSVVAYLNAVPSMTAQDQTALTGGTSGAAGCTACHGRNGQSNNSFVPRLDILTPDQITQALIQYRDGTRPSGIMQEAATGLSDAQIAGIASKFGTTQAGVLQGHPAPETDATGVLLATRGTAEVPACSVCHGPGRKADAPIAPVLSGQSQAYLKTQLTLWRDGRRDGGPRARLMTKAAQDLSDEQIAELAAWYAGLRSLPGRQ